MNYKEKHLIMSECSMNYYNILYKQEQHTGLIIISAYFVHNM